MKNKHEVRYTSRIACSAILLAALGTGLYSISAAAGDHKDHGAKAMSKEQFERIDADGDGRLSRDEYNSMTMDQSSGATDEAGGQGLPATEHQAEAVRGFDDLDSDGDGHISADELSEAETSDSSSTPPSPGSM